MSCASCRNMPAFIAIKSAARSRRRAKLSAKRPPRRRTESSAPSARTLPLRTARLIFPSAQPSMRLSRRTTRWWSKRCNPLPPRPSISSACAFFPRITTTTTMSRRCTPLRAARTARGTHRVQASPSISVWNASFAASPRWAFSST